MILLDDLMIGVGPRPNIAASNGSVPSLKGDPFIIALKA